MIFFTMNSIARHAVLAASFGVFSIISGCASGPQANPTDPLEPFNRGMYSFNEGIDKAILKPAARGYRAITPSPVRAGVHNVFNNLEDLWSGLNGILQLRPQVAIDNLVRFGMNSFLGLGGLLDIASEAGIERSPEDLGKTLGRWGVPAGPYLVFPLLGPSTVRDATMIVVENRFNPISQIDHTRTRNSATALRAIDTRSNLLRVTDMLDEAALDKYSFTRDAFLQKRRAEIFRPGTGDEEGDSEKAKKADIDKK